MSVPLTVQGVTFNYPQQFDTNWGPTLTNWSTAVTNALAALPSAGVLTLSPYPGAQIKFANATNSGFLVLTTNSSNQLTFQGTPLATSGGGTVNLGTANQLGYYATTGTAISGLTSITANRALESDVNGLPIASGVTSTTLAFLDATSSIQTQLNTKAPSASPTFTGTVTVPNGIVSTSAINLSQLANVQYNFQPANYFQGVQSFTTTSLSFSSIGISLTFTPTSASNRVKITVTGTMGVQGSGGIGIASIFRGSTNLAGGSSSVGFATVECSSSGQLFAPVCMVAMDFPATTGTLLYTIQLRSNGSTAAWGGPGGVEYTTAVIEELQ